MAADADSPLIWLRSEVKPGEARTPLTPANAEKLIAAGYRVKVERWADRCFADNEYASVGCELVATNSWHYSAPKSAFIVGLKELPDKPDVLKHRHVYFAHCFKGQTGAHELLQRFRKGGGEILDWEFCTYESGKSMASFGWAGVCGMAVGILAWCAQILDEDLNRVKPWKSADAMVADLRSQLKHAVAKSSRKTLPKVLIIGALGKCGNGAVWTAKQCGIAELSEWDLAETKIGGPFDTIVKDHDIFINCIYLTTKIPPFITKEMISQPDRRLRTIVDVSCDCTSANNPVPVYDRITTVFDPVLPIIRGDNSLHMVAIDHLPTLAACDASVEFSNAFISTMLQLKDTHNPVWKRARQKFYQVSDKVLRSKL